MADIRNIFSVDVEEWFHILGAGCAVPVDDWGALESRVEHNTQRLLDLLDAFDTVGTFFILGWIAERYPSLVREIARRGHEIASHGYYHQLVFDQSPDTFRKDVADARKILQDMTGAPVAGYRAPGFSITQHTLWALDVLLDEGYTYDSSVFPMRRGHGGLPGVSDRPHYIETPQGRSILEFPISTARYLGKTWAFSGGGYLRAIPGVLIEAAMRQANEEPDKLVVLYVHPRETDLDQPRLKGLPLHRHFKYYYGLKTVEVKLKRLLQSFRFQPFRDLCAQCPEHDAALHALKP